MATILMKQCYLSLVSSDEAAASCQLLILRCNVHFLTTKSGNEYAECSHYIVL